MHNQKHSTYLEVQHNYHYVQSKKVDLEAMLMIVVNAEH